MPVGTFIALWWISAMFLLQLVILMILNDA